MPVLSSAKGKEVERAGERARKKLRENCKLRSLCRIHKMRRKKKEGDYAGNITKEEEKKKIIEKVVCLFKKLQTKLSQRRA